MKKVLYLLLVVLISTGFVFCKKKKTELDAKPLVNTYWELAEIENVPIQKSPKTPYLLFTPDSKFNGNLGCNLCFGEYFAGKKKISLDYMGATKRYCSDMNVENQFTSAMKKEITHFSIDHDTLRLLNKKVEILRFIATDSVKLGID